MINNEISGEMLQNSHGDYVQLQLSNKERKRRNDRWIFQSDKAYTRVTQYFTQ